MIKFSPSILSADFTNLGTQLQILSAAGVPYLHIDVMDGIFVPQISFGMPVIRSIRKDTDQFFDVHLMIQNPERYVKDFAACGADSITFHLEAAEDPDSVIRAIRQEGKKVGLALKPKTPVEAALPYLEKIDMLLLMTVEPGFGGQKYIPASTDKIRKARKLISERDLSIDIEVDGGINDGNLDTVLGAGANVIVEGSSAFHGNLGANARKFLQHCKNRPEGCLLLAV